MYKAKKQRKHHIIYKYYGIRKKRKKSAKLIPGGD